MFGQFISDFKPKARKEYNPSAISLREYAYSEDCNYSNRQNMEDGENF